MKPGSSLENDVQQLYSSLLNMRDEGVVVGKRIIVNGKSGVQHEIDVYYEFTKAGIRHRVAIECKDWATPVAKGQVQEFESKLRDIGTIIGVIVSRNGYQSGAIDFAKFNDIIPLKFEDLPSFRTILAERLKTVALPDDSYIGEPFWIIMEIRDGEITGSHYATRQFGSSKALIPLMFSRQHAEQFFENAGLEKSKWAIRGLPRFAFRAFLLTLELYEKRMNGGAVICFRPPGSELDAPFIGIQAFQSDLIREYYGEPIPSIEDSVNSRTKNNLKL